MAIQSDCPNPSSGILALALLRLTQNSFPRSRCVLCSDLQNSQLIQLINVVLGLNHGLLPGPSLEPLREGQPSTSAPLHIQNESAAPSLTSETVYMLRCP